MGYNDAETKVKLDREVRAQTNSAMDRSFTNTVNAGRAPEIPMLLDQLEKSCHQAMEEFARLVQQLEPVIESRPESANQTSPTPPAAMTQLGDKIVQIQNVVYVLIHRITMVREGIAL